MFLFLGSRVSIYSNSRAVFSESFGNVSPRMESPLNWGQRICFVRSLLTSLRLVYFETEWDIWQLWGTLPDFIPPARIERSSATFTFSIPQERVNFFLFWRPVCVEKVETHEQSFISRYLEAALTLLLGGIRHAVSHNSPFIIFHFLFCLH